ncbi:MAG: hypothetical protein FD175_676 [Beijerinckiaceae bacterium]|nr:MAG: hypothetical protein FD175_676 [Beijerinckiaceae bacterium]
MAVLKLLRTIRLDPSDGFVFTRAAEPGEWAVAGTFLFWERPVETLIGKERTAFRSGLLGVGSFGWSTLATVVEASADERAALVERLATQLVAHCGAPDMAAALVAAEAEVAYAQELAEPPVGTLVAVHRSLDNGEIIERFRTLLPGTDERHSRVFSFVEEPDDADVIEEAVDLVGLAATGTKTKGSATT